MIRPLKWVGAHLEMLDQRRLPAAEAWIVLENWRAVRDAIADMAVRGAPAIGIAAGYALALAARAGESLEQVGRELIATRPTAVNLRWAVERILALGTSEGDAVLAEAMSIEREDIEMNRRIAGHGEALIPQGAGILTICNTGGLATGGYGTALGIIRRAHETGKQIRVFACETRPRQQGLRLTAWELLKDGIPFQAIPDGSIASLMASGQVQCTIAGADRIAANGDTANKIGTYSLAVAARHFDIPFYVAAPSSTLDPATLTGADIPIEERSPDELTTIEGVRIAPEGCPVWNPAFDVTPGELISAIITEEGVFRFPYVFGRERASAQIGP